MAKVTKQVLAGAALLSLSAANLAIAATAPRIISRAEWRAPDPIMRPTPPIREVTTGRKKILSENELIARDTKELEFLTVHSTGIPRPSVPDVSGKMKSLRTMVQHGYQVHPTLFSYMAEILYHYVILRDGQIAEGRALMFPAATNTRDSDYGRSIDKHLTVVVELAFWMVNDETVTLPPTSEQLKSLRDLLESLAIKHKITATNIGYHKQYANSSCPGPALITATMKIRDELLKKGL